MRRIALLSCFLYFLFIQLKGEIVYETISINSLNGLSQNDVSAILQDSKGFIWIGTNGGINKFDGYSFTYYDFSNTNNTFGASIIGSLVEDHYQNIWIGTGKDGLVYYNTKLEIFETALHDSITGGISHLSTDGKNRLWVVSDAGLLMMKANDEQKFKHYTTIYRNSSLANQNVRKAVHLGDTCFFMTPSGLFTVDSKSGAVRQLPLFSNSNLSDIAIYKNKVVVLLSNGDLLWGNSSVKFTRLINFPATRILITNTGHLFFGTSTGIYESGIANNSISTPVLKHRYTNIKVTVLMADNLSNLWIGATRNGITVMYPKTKQFRHYKSARTSGTLTDNKVEQIVEDENKNLWIATRNGGVDLLPDNSRNYENGFVNFPYYMNENIALTVTHNNGIPGILFCGDNGVNRIENRRVTRNVFSVDNTTNHIMAILDDKRYVWIGYFGKGLIRVHNLNERQYSKFTYNSRDNQSISSDVVRSLLKDKKGNLWIGTTNGISILTPGEQLSNTPRFIRISRSNQALSLSHNYILPMCEASDGSMWIGTFGGGLNKIIVDSSFNIVNNTVFSTANGLSNNFIKGILEDRNKNIWISTNRGLNKIIPGTNEIRNYDVSDGLQDFEFSELSYCKRSDGELVFGGVNGFNAFYPDEIQDNSIAPTLLITNFELLNKRVYPYEKRNNRILLKQSISDTKELELNYNQNSFSFEFAVLQYIAVQKIKYEYQLEGFDQQPILTSASNRVANYTNLAPGSYRFVVRATNSDGVWLDKTVSLDITILSPVWARWYAYFFYFVLLAGIIVYLRRNFLKNQHQKFQILTANHEREEAKKNIELKTRFFMDVSHEFRTPLTLIMAPLQKILEEKRRRLDKETVDNLKIIQSNTDSLLRLINQLMDFSKHDEEKLELHFQTVDICSFTAGLFNQFEPWCTQKELQLKLTLPDYAVEVNFDKGYMEQIFLNLISNAVKNCRTGGVVSLTVNVYDTVVVIAVQDEGYGIPKVMAERIFERYYSTSVSDAENKGTGIGLSLTKSLVELHGGKIWFETREGEGTSFFLQFDLAGEKAETTTSIFSDSASIEEVMDIVDEVGEQKKLLIADDNPEIIDLLVSIFAESYEVLVAVDGEDAWQKCITQLPDLILSDIMMPKMDGMALCKRVKWDERTSHIPVILLTARGTSQNVVEGMMVNADAYCSKPFNINVLKATIRSVLTNRMLLQSKFNTNSTITPSELVTTSIDERFLTKLLRIIEENIEDAEYTVEAMAAAMGYDQEVLNRKLKAITGQTARPFLRIVRLRKAAELLRLNRYSIADVTFEVGFTDIKYFRDCFKKEFGMTPTEYCRNNNSR